MELKNGGKLNSWHAATMATYGLTVPVVVSEGSCTIGANQGYFSIKDVEVQGGATLAVEKGTASITGTLSGSGTITGSGLSFSGNDSCWQIVCKSAKRTEKVNLEQAPANFLAGLKKIEVVSDGGSSVYDLAPAPGLVDVSQVQLTVTNKTTGAPIRCATLEIRDGRLYIRIPSGLMLIFGCAVRPTDQAGLLPERLFASASCASALSA